MNNKKWWLIMLFPAAFVINASDESSINDDWDDDGWSNESWEDEPLSPWEFGAFLEAGFGGRAQNDPAKNTRTTLAETRGRLELAYIADQFQISGKGDAVYDDVLHKTQWQTRELAVSFSPLERLDIKAGRQVLTWGTGDYLFLNDLFPKDWQSFFAGRDDEYLKAPSDSLKTSWYADSFSVDLVWTPKFTPDHTLNGERFSFFSPVTGSHIAPDPAVDPDRPSGDTWSGRVASTYNSIEYAFYGYLGYWTSPLGANEQGRPRYPQMNSWGASIRAPLGKGLISSEFAWYDSREDRAGMNPLVPNSQLRWLLGYEQELAQNLSAGFQYYLEWTQDYEQLRQNSPYPELETEEYRQLLTGRLTWLTLQQKLVWSLFVFWSPTDRDSWIKPGVDYRFNDNWSISGGANLFVGKQSHTFFGQHENNSNIWSRVRFSF